MAEQTITSEITITPEAAEEIRRVRVENNIPESLILRLGVKSSGGCCGSSYLLGFDDKSNDSDRVFHAEGLTVLIDLQSLTQLSGATLGFSDGPEGRGFFFNNPNSEGCNCGEGGCEH